jgi:hypothetical protein
MFSVDDLVRSGFEQIRGAIVGTWLFELRGHDECWVRLRASGFRLHLRAEPVVSERQQLSASERGAISFDVTGSVPAPRQER